MEDDIEEFIEMMLEDEDFETILEHFDLTPQEVFMQLCYDGLIDTELLREIMGK